MHNARRHTRESAALALLGAGFSFTQVKVIIQNAENGALARATTAQREATMKLELEGAYSGNLLLAIEERPSRRPLKNGQMPTRRPGVRGRRVDQVIVDAPLVKSSGTRWGRSRADGSVPASAYSPELGDLLSFD